jgi:Mg2+ and Co2+ transporter CorA
MSTEPGRGRQPGSQSAQSSHFGLAMQWHDIQNPDHKLLDDLPARYSLHPLHVEDCRQESRRTKVENGDGYLFISLKQLVLDDSGRLSTDDVALFVGGDFLVTVHRVPVALLEPLRSSPEELRPDQVLHRIMDGIVDSYIPLVEKNPKPETATVNASGGELDRLPRRSCSKRRLPCSRPGR